MQVYGCYCKMFRGPTFLGHSVERNVRRGGGAGGSDSFLSLSLQCSAIEQVLDILTDILSWEIAEVVSPCLPRGLLSEIVIRVFLLLGAVCPQHHLGATLLFLRAFPYLQPGDVGGRCSAPAVC